MYPLKVFDIKPYLDLANQLVCADEVLMALKLLDMLPAYYRQNYPPELLAMKREIMARIATSSFYATDRGCELETTDETCASYINTLRARLIVHDIQVLNDDGHKVFVYDFAPGENWLAIVLENAGCDFAYKPIFVNHPSNEKFKYRYEKFLFEKPEGPTLYSCCEVLEHMHFGLEIRCDMERNVGLPTLIHLSTPNGTFAPNVTNWKTIGDLGHLRTWSISEFRDFISSTFPDFQQSIYESQVMHARLFDPKTKYESIKVHYNLDMKNESN